jgi:hypothetical protein
MKEEEKNSRRRHPSGKNPGGAKTPKSKARYCQICNHKEEAHAKGEHTWCFATIKDKTPKGEGYSYPCDCEGFLLTPRDRYLVDIERNITEVLGDLTETNNQFISWFEPPNLD